MVSISELSGASGNSDDDDDDQKSDKPKPRPKPPMKLESIMSNASFICSAEFDNILDEPTTPKSGVKKRVSFRNEDKLSSIMDDDFSEDAVVVLSSSDPFEYSLSDSLTEKEDVTPLAHAVESDKLFSDNSTVSKSSTKENLVSDKKADLVAPAVSTSNEAKPEDDGISSKPPVACCVIS